MKTRRSTRSVKSETKSSMDLLVAENKELKNQLKLFTEFKLFFEHIFNKLSPHLTRQQLSRFKAFNHKFNKLFGHKFIKLIDENTDDINGSVETIVKTETIENQNSNEINFNQTFGDNSENIEIDDNIKQIDNKKPLKQQKSDSLKNLKNKSKDIHDLEEDKRFVCDFIGCGLTYKTERNLKRHKKIHTNKRRIVCDWEGCHYATNSRDNLRKHLRRHSGKNFICVGYEGCHKRYINKIQLNKHIELSHTTTERAFKCSFEGCPKAFKFDFQLNAHINRMHTYREKTVSCDVKGCQFRTFNKFSLETHRIYSHSDERPFQCTFEGCLKTYKTEIDMKAHELAFHQKEPHFKCCEPNCGKQFRYTQALKSHIRMNHSIVKIVISCDWPGCDFTTNATNKMTRHKVSHSTERNFVCSWPECGKGFKKKYYLSVHMAIHRNDKRYACGWPGCVYRSAIRSNIVKHERNHNK